MVKHVLTGTDLLPDTTEISIHIVSLENHNDVLVETFMDVDSIMKQNDNFVEATMYGNSSDVNKLILNHDSVAKVILGKASQRLIASNLLLI